MSKCASSVESISWILVGAFHFFAPKLTTRWMTSISPSPFRNRTRILPISDTEWACLLPRSSLSCRQIWCHCWFHGMFRFRDSGKCLWSCSFTFSVRILSMQFLLLPISGQYTCWLSQMQWRKSQTCHDVQKWIPFFEDRIQTLCLCYALYRAKRHFSTER